VFSKITGNFEITQPVQTLSNVISRPIDANSYTQVRWALFDEKTLR